MNNAELLVWVNDPARTPQELAEACRGLGQPDHGNAIQRRARLRRYLEGLPPGAKAAYDPAKPARSRRASVRQATAAHNTATPRVAATTTPQPPYPAPTGTHWDYRRKGGFGRNRNERRYVLVDDQPTHPVRETVWTNQEGKGDMRSMFLASLVGLVIGLIIVGLWADEGWWPFGDDDNISIPAGNGNGIVRSDDDAADIFGGDEDDWQMVSGSGGTGWHYSGRSTEMRVPSGYRIDYPGHTCAGSNSGIYGPTKIGDVTDATIWHVPGETKCPTQAAGNSGNTGSTGAAANPNSGAQSGSTGTSNQQNNKTTVKMIETPQDQSRCKDDAWAQSVLTADVQGLGTEECSWVIRPKQVGAVNATCPTGWVCTIHLSAGDRIIVVIGDGKSYQAVAGTFRYIIGFALGDDIREVLPCRVLAKEQKYGSERKPSFPVFAGNFSCIGGGSSQANSQPTTQQSGQTCGEPAADLGGGVWVAKPGKYELQGSATIHGHPAWTVHTNRYSIDPGLPPGVTEATNGASAYCDPYKG